MFKLVLLAALFLLLVFAIKQSVNSLNTSIKENNSPEGKENVIESNLEKIKLQVYYETLCPDSLHFLQYQLEPLFFNNLLWRRRIKVELIPYGKAHTTKVGISKYKFSCQHGSRECEGNRLHSCAIRYLPTFNSVLHFITCTMKIMNSASATSSSEVNLLSCIDPKTVPSSIYRRVFSCYKLREGDEILMRHGKRTDALNPKLTFVPWIVINEQFRNDVQQRSLYDLKGVLCAYISAQDAYERNKNINRRRISTVPTPPPYPIPVNNEFEEECRFFYRERRHSNNSTMSPSTTKANGRNKSP